MLKDEQNNFSFENGKNKVPSQPPSMDENDIRNGELNVDMIHVIEEPETVVKDANNDAKEGEEVKKAKEGEEGK